MANNTHTFRRMADEPKDRKPPRQDPAALRWCREAKGWKQRDIAALCGVSEGHWSKMESGTASASPDLLNTIARTLNCPTSILENKVEWQPFPQRVA